jgi:hypothetical protein
VAIASDVAFAAPLPLLPLGDPAAVARFIAEHLGLEPDHRGPRSWRS